MAVTQAQVAQLYVALFNRAPEGAGFNAWVAAGATKTVAQMANEMLASPATPPYFASLGIDISTDRGYVENIYKNILGKDYSQDPDGINAWVRHLQLGNSRGDTLVKLFEVATSAEARAADPVAAQTFANKTAISQYAAQKIADIPTDENGAYDFSLFQRIIAQTNNTNLDEQKAAIDALVAPTVHNLSSDANNVSGTDKADLFNGAVSATVNQTTFKDTDKIDGKGGNDTLNLDMYTNFYGLATDRGEVKNIENLKLTNHTSGHLTFNARNIHDMQTISIDGSTYKYGLDIINPENKVKLNLKNIDLSQTGAQNLRLIYNTDVLAGSNDDQEVTVDNVKTGNNKINITTVNNDKVEAVTINALSGVNKLTGFISDHVGSSDDSSIKTIKVKGSAELEITGPSSLQTFDASAYTGNKLTANLKANGSVQHIIGSSQDDTFNVTGATGAIIPINGGAGRDTVNINGMSGSHGQHVEMSGVEILNVNLSSSGATLDFSRAQEIDTLGIGGANANVLAINSNIKTVNANAAGENKVTLDGVREAQFNVVNGNRPAQFLSTTVQKLNALINKDTINDFRTNTPALKELNLTVEKSADSIDFYADNAQSIETLNVVNKYASTFNQYVNNGGSNVEPYNALTLKTLNVETKGDYNVGNHLSGISLINLKALDDETNVTFQKLGVKTYAPNPYQGIQDITLNAQNLKTLSVAAPDKIVTTRNVSLTSTTDKEGATVTYGQIGDSATAKANDVSINATGQKTLTTGNIYANGDVNLTTHFTQEGSSAIYAKETVSTDTSVVGEIKARNFSLNHSANSGITDGIIRTNGNLDATGNLTVNASGYKELKMSVTPVTAFSPITDWEKINVGGDAKFNTTATVAGASTEIGYQPSPTVITPDAVTVKSKSLSINANAASGITDSTLKLSNYESLGGNIDITANNQKTVDIGWLRGFNTSDSSKKSDVNINLNTNVADARVKIGTEDNTYKFGIGSLLPSSPTDHIEVKNVNFKAYGQKTLDVKGIWAEGDVNIDVKGNGIESTATFKAHISGNNVTINANNLRELNLPVIHGKDVFINTGTNNYLQNVTLDSIGGDYVTLDASNMSSPITPANGPSVNIGARKGVTIKAHAGNAVSSFVIDAVVPEIKEYIIDIINVKGAIYSYAGGDMEVLKIKGGITNPDSLIAAGENSDLEIIWLRGFDLKTIDLSEYENKSGKTKVETDNAFYNEKVATILGSKTKDELNISSVNLKFIDTGAGDDKVNFLTQQNKDVVVNLGVGDDTIVTTTLSANKKFEISGGAGNDTFNLGASTTDASASKYITITDANRGDKISLGSAGAATLQKIALNVDGRADLKTAINDALGSLSSTAANTIYAVYYGNDTYLVRDANSNKALDANDNLVKLAGISNFDLLNANSVTEGGINYIQITNA